MKELIDYSEWLHENYVAWGEVEDGDKTYYNLKTLEVEIIETVVIKYLNK